MTQAERTAISDRRMFEAAVKLVSAKGLRNTTLKEVGIHAGYSRGLASGRFGSKEALFEALVDYCSKQWTAELDKFLIGRRGLSAISSGMHAVEHFLLHAPQYVTTLYTLWYESIGSHSPARSRVAHIVELQRRDIARWVEQDIAEGNLKPTMPAERLAVQYCALIFGIIYQYMVDSREIDFKQAFRDCRQTMALLLNLPSDALEK